MRPNASAATSFTSIPAWARTARTPTDCTSTSGCASRRSISRARSDQRAVTKPGRVAFKQAHGTAHFARGFGGLVRLRRAQFVRLTKFTETVEYGVHALRISVRLMGRA